MSTNAMETIEKIGLLPLVNVDDPNKAVPIAKALCDGGVAVVEVALRNPAALESIANIRRDLPELTLCAGTVLSAEQAEKAIKAGADFIVTPGLNPQTVKFCQEKNVPIIPGATTATELELGVSLGLNVFKFFPADVAGGLNAIKALRGPFGAIRFVPTGGINLDNMKAYCENSAVLAVGGSFMTPKSAIASENWGAITAVAAQAVEISLGLAMGHVGINCNSSEEASETAEWFNERFGLATRETGISFFAGAAVETMKKPSYGEKGHIAIATNSMARAVYQLQRRGVKFRDFKYNPQGGMIAAYLEEEIGGFAVHLCVKY